MCEQRCSKGLQATLISGDKMIYLKRVALLAIATAVVPASLEAQTGKIGVINTNQVLAESAIGVAAGNDFNEYVTESQQPLLDLEAEIAVRSQQLEDQQRALSESALATRAAELERLNRDFTRGQEDYALDLETKQAQVLEPVYTLANSTIDAYAIEAGYQLIIDPTAAQGLLVYMDEASDVTLEIISRMDDTFAAAEAGASTSAPEPTPAPAAAAPTP